MATIYVDKNVFMENPQKYLNLVVKPEKIIVRDEKRKDVTTLEVGKYQDDNADYLRLHRVAGGKTMDLVICTEKLHTPEYVESLLMFMENSIEDNLLIMSLAKTQYRG